MGMLELLYKLRSSTARPAPKARRERPPKARTLSEEERLFLKLVRRFYRLYGESGFEAWAGVNLKRRPPGPSKGSTK
jgi:hypothetical protein